MSSLQRYKKSGGFSQLLSLIETFGPQKREKFLEMIEAESKTWANALRERMLSLERIFGWDVQVVVEIFKRLPVKNQAFAFNGLKEEQRAKLMPLISASEQRRMNDVMAESKPKPEEVQAALLKIVEVTRQMIKDRELSPERFDERLIIQEDIESKLEENSAVTFVQELAEPSGSGAPEVQQLQRNLGVVLKENKALKEEVKILRDKLEQIRKIA